MVNFYETCKICDSDRLKTLFVSRQSNLPVMKCKACGLVFIGLRFKEKDQKQFYNDINFYQQFAEAQRSTEAIHKRHRQWINQIKDRLFFNNNGNYKIRPSLLDVGCGVGDFLTVAREQGFQVRGQDISEAAAQLAYKWNKIKVQTVDLSAFASDSEDVVTLIGLLEHVTEPKSILEQAYRILKNNGILFIYTPVWGMYDHLTTFIARTLDGRFTIFINRRINKYHLQVFPQFTLEQLLKKIGFGITDCNRICEYNLPVEKYLKTIGINRKRILEVFANNTKYLINHNLFFRNNMRVFAHKHI